MDSSAHRLHSEGQFRVRAPAHPQSQEEERKMTSSENSMEKMMAEAERLGKEQTELEERNRKRRAKGRKPLPDAQERKDMDVGRRKYRTGDYTTVDAADAMKLFEMRKSEMMSGRDDFIDDDEEESAEVRPVRRRPLKKSGNKDEEQAIREAEAARRIQDMKNGRVDHEGNWSPEGPKIESGDKTVIVDKAVLGKVWGDPEQEEPSVDERDKSNPSKPTKKAKNVAEDTLDEFKEDLFRRLGVSFDAIERTLSDLQGRVSEIVTASTPKDIPDGVNEDEFKDLLSQKSQVVFDVGGTKITFDAITVFHAPPCITVVSKIGSAKITPKPGAQLLLSYMMDGESYVNDPVTFLGTRFDLPMFGLSFVGFIRDSEADLIDAAAGIGSGENSAGGAE